MIFGGADLTKFAKAGSTDKDVFWMKKATNENYWTVNSNKVLMG